MTLNEEKYLKQYIKNFIIESFGDFVNEEDDLLDEINTKETHKSKKDDDENKSKQAKENMKNKRSRVINRLKSDDVNAAEYMRKLWKPSKDEEDSARSYFYKCRDGELNDSGIPYQFSDDEINKLYQYLTSQL